MDVYIIRFRNGSSLIEGRNDKGKDWIRKNMIADRRKMVIVKTEYTEEIAAEMRLANIEVEII